MVHERPDIGTFVENGTNYRYINVEEMEPGTTILVQTPTAWYILSTIERGFSGVHIEGRKYDGTLTIPKQSMFLFGGSYDREGNSLPDLIAEQHSFFGVLSNEGGNTNLESDLVTSIHAIAKDGTHLVEPKPIMVEDQMFRYRS